jgi:hypothetical protein
VLRPRSMQIQTYCVLIQPETCIYHRDGYAYTPRIRMYSVCCTCRSGTRRGSRAVGRLESVEGRRSLSYVSAVRCFFRRAASFPWRDTSTSPFLNCVFVRFLFLILVRIWSAMCDRATFSTRNLESLMAVLNQLKQQGSRNFLVSAMDYNIGENQSVFYGFLVKKQNQKN